MRGPEDMQLEVTNSPGPKGSEPAMFELNCSFSRFISRYSAPLISSLKAYGPMIKRFLRSYVICISRKKIFKHVRPCQARSTQSLPSYDSYGRQLPC